MSWGAILFLALGLILFAGVILCALEPYSTATGKDPTISRVVAYSFAKNPHLYVVAGVILGAAVTHFTNWHV
jgi:hypothetical protein